MIKPGDIVFQRYTGGLNNGKPKTSRLGLVIKEYKEKGAIPQFYVQFSQEDPKWYYQHDLHRIIGGERNKND
mgnify:CR=1 FL=1|tara:strand:+ start:252 stop:467 length:216 start_codon:yes stop_codon:yes gene_type:complete